jgi:hypothetical protein
MIDRAEYNVKNREKNAAKKAAYRAVIREQRAARKAEAL